MKIIKKKRKITMMHVAMHVELVLQTIEKKFDFFYYCFKNLFKLMIYAECVCVCFGLSVICELVPYTYI